MRTINAAGLALLHDFEGYVGHAYPDPYSPLGKALQRAGLWRQYLQAPVPIPADLRGLSGAPWTIGYGFTKGVREGDRITRAQGTARLQAELRTYVDAVLQACTVEPNDNELAAMTCLAWNIGVAGFGRSTVLRRHNAGDAAAASRAFGLWNQAGGQVSPGLVRRRAAEAALYLRPVPQSTRAPQAAAEAEALPEVLPQRVDDESRMAQSPINRAAIGAGATAGITAAAEVARTAAEIKGSAEALGPWLVPMLLVLVVALCGYIVWQRVKQRKGGWA